MSTSGGSVIYTDPAKIDYLIKARTELVDPAVEGVGGYQEFLKFATTLVDHPHYLRYCQCVAELCHHVPELWTGTPLRVLETGGLSPVAAYLRQVGHSVEASSSDLRYPMAAATGAYDIILSLEVLEHLKDQTERNFDEVTLFQGSGSHCYIAEISRILNTEGALILTTPNPCSIRAVQNILSGQAPYVFRPHVREYTKTELLAMVQAAGLRVEAYCTKNAFFNLFGCLEHWVPVLFGDDLSERGDDHFLIARKAPGLR